MTLRSLQKTAGFTLGEMLVAVSVSSIVLAAAIASSTDQLVPQSTDVELANTEYTNTAVTFMPIFTMSGSPAARTGTSLFSTAYLRNKRRG